MVVEVPMEALIEVSSEASSEEVSLLACRDARPHAFDQLLTDRWRDRISEREMVRVLTDLWKLGEAEIDGRHACFLVNIPLLGRPSIERYATLAFSNRHYAIDVFADREEAIAFFRSVVPRFAHRDARVATGEYICLAPDHRPILSLTPKSYQHTVYPALFLLDMESGQVLMEMRSQ